MHMQATRADDVHARLAETARMPPASCVSDSAKIDFQEKLIPERGLRSRVVPRKFGNRLIWKWVTCREHFDSKSKD
jgi:hypothetical protein